ncbi:hypothetical protein [Dehalogenimonas etheniformans]|nr:hypothetical protein [Dehalogenimonas etheniformans]QNT76154.1 hypothetical protein HX448_05340 [Dehalogenimonas etheniformans]
MKPACVFYFGGWSASIRDRLIASKPEYVILDLSTWPRIPPSDITLCKNAGITLCAYIPTGGMRGYIWNELDTTDKTPAGLDRLINQAVNIGLNGVFFDEGGLYTPVAGRTWQDAFLDRTLVAPGSGAGVSSPPILSVIGNPKYNATTAEAWKGLTAEYYINHAKEHNMFVIVGCPDEYVRPSRINSNIFPIVNAVLTSEEYNTRAPGLAPVGQEKFFTNQCFVLSYSGSYDASSTNSAINYGFGAAYCSISLQQLPSPAFENYMAAITEVVPPTTTTPPPTTTTPPPTTTTPPPTTTTPPPTTTNPRPTTTTPPPTTTNPPPTTTTPPPTTTTPPPTTTTPPPTTTAVTPSQPTVTINTGGGGGGFGAQLVGINLSGTSPFMDGNGKSLTVGKIQTPDGELTLQIPASVYIWNAAGAAQPFLSAQPITGILPETPIAEVLCAYEMGPVGATFNPSVNLMISYKVDKLPVGCQEDDLYIGWWDGTKWIKLQSAVDPVSDTVTAPISHFSIYGLLAPINPTSFSVQEIPPQQTRSDEQQLMESIVAEILPLYASDGSISRIDIDYRLPSPVTTLGLESITLVFEVIHDEKVIDTKYYSLSLSDDNGLLQYIPETDWGNGSYNFTVAVEQTAGFFDIATEAVEISIQPNNEISNGTVVRWNLLATLVGWSIALSIILIMVLLVRFKQLKNNR